MNTAMQTAAIYARVSSERQRKKKSLENQLEKCREYAQREGFTVLPEHEFHDVFTGTKLQRPAFDRVKDVAGKVNAIIFHVADRLSRADVLDSVQQIRWFEESGTEVHITNRGRVDTTDEMALIILILEFSAAHKERDDIIRRTSGGRFDRVAGGKLCQGDKAYYGYNYDPVSGKYTLNELEAPWVAKMFYWHAVERLGYLAIANRLQELNVPTKWDNLGRTKAKTVRCRWAIGTISNILRATVYKGVWEYGGQKDGRRATVEVPVIISPELWEKCQEVSRSNRKNNNKGRQTYPALLYGRMTCTQCGKTFAQKHDPRSGRRQYVCFGQKKAYSADGKSKSCFGGFNLLSLDEQIWDALADALRNPANIIEGFRADREEKLSKTQYDRDYLERCKSELSRLDDKLARLKASYLDGSWPLEDFKKDKALIDFARQTQQEKIAELEQSLAEVEHDEMSIQAFERYCERIRVGIDVLTLEEKRQIIEALNVRARLHRGTSVRRRHGWQSNGTITLEAIVPLDIAIELTSDDSNLALASYAKREVHSIAFSLTVQLNNAA